MSRRKKGRASSQRRRASSRERRAPKRKRRASSSYTVIIGAVLLLGVWLIGRTFLGSGDAAERGQVVLVEANMSGFRPKVIRVKAGEPVTVRLKSLDTPFHTDGGGKHQFAIDELGVDIIAPPGGTREATFTVSEPGVYGFYCSVCCGGKANRAMWGRLIVKA